jgi:hypothetical protein
MYPNTDLSAWALAIMAVVAVVTLAAWLIAIFAAAREPVGHEQAAAGVPTGSAAAVPDSRSPATAGDRERERPAAGRAAA